VNDGETGFGSLAWFCHLIFFRLEHEMFLSKRSAMRLVWIGCGAAALMAVGAQETSAAPASAVTTVNLRQGPGTTYTVVTKIPAGAALDVGDCHGQWCEVTFQNEHGYVIATSIAEPDEGGPAGNPPPGGPPPGGPPPGAVAPPPGAPPPGAIAGGPPPPPPGYDEPVYAGPPYPYPYPYPYYYGGYRAYYGPGPYYGYGYGGHRRW
jgi:Bacterial SH3 domain